MNVPQGNDLFHPTLQCPISCFIKNSYLTLAHTLARVPTLRNEAVNTLWTKPPIIMMCSKIPFYLLSRFLNSARRRLLLVHQLRSKNNRIGPIIGNKAPVTIVRCQLWYIECFHFPSQMVCFTLFWLNMPILQIEAAFEQRISLSANVDISGKNYNNALTWLRKYEAWASYSSFVK